ncbi:unnamed protein product [Cyprideis torosa]|uniref:Uncharacterized protein n=1 Tax=Cyprideis torosa TaxID=163714 RepID=A0A7R8WDG0_9CRUS|nr:unnamed protein product [Cyprideis torosa]CAG0894690.1 unnamed protein product [Cyprideis torosa]
MSSVISLEPSARDSRKPTAAGFCLRPCSRASILLSSLFYRASILPSFLFYRAAILLSSLFYRASILPSSLFYRAAILLSSLFYRAAILLSSLFYRAAILPSSLFYRASILPSFLFYRASILPSFLFYRAAILLSSLFYRAAILPSSLFYRASILPSSLFYRASILLSSLFYRASILPSSLFYRASILLSSLFYRAAILHRSLVRGKWIWETSCPTDPPLLPLTWFHSSSCGIGSPPAGAQLKTQTTSIFPPKTRSEEQRTPHAVVLLGVFPSCLNSTATLRVVASKAKGGSETVVLSRVTISSQKEAYSIPPLSLSAPDFQNHNFSALIRRKPLPLQCENIVPFSGASNVCVKRTVGKMREGGMRRMRKMPTWKFLRENFPQKRFIPLFIPFARTHSTHYAEQKSHTTWEMDFGITAPVRLSPTSPFAPPHRRSLPAAGGETPRRVAGRMQLASLRYPPGAEFKRAPTTTSRSPAREGSYNRRRHRRSSTSNSTRYQTESQADRSDRRFAIDAEKRTPRSCAYNVHYSPTQTVRQPKVSSMISKSPNSGRHSKLAEVSALA